MEDLKALISKLDFFKSLSPKYLDLICGCASNQRLKKGAFVFTEGQPADNFYFIREGRVNLEAHIPGSNSVVVETISAGEPLGWSWLIPPYVWHFDARVSEELRFFSFDAKCLRKKMEDDPRLGFELMKLFSQIMVKRLQATRVRMLDVFASPEGK